MSEMMNQQPSRRGVLGALGIAGAAALAKIALPFRAEAQDIVIASEMPPVAAGPESGPIADDWLLYNKRGEPVAVIRSAHVETEIADTSIDSRYRTSLSGLRRGYIEAELIEPAKFGWR